MRLKYRNNKGVSLDLSGGTYLLDGAALFDYAWSYTARGTGRDSYIEAFYRNTIEKAVDIEIKAHNRHVFAAALNHFHDVTHTDIALAQYGRLELDTGEYMLCHIPAVKKPVWKDDIRAVVCNVTILTTRPAWCRDVHYFHGLQGDREHRGDDLGYPHGYPHDYGMFVGMSLVQNNHYTPCEFEMTMYGPVTNPEVKIGPNVYAIGTESNPVALLTSSDRIIINSREREAKQHSGNGVVIDRYNDRVKEYGGFELIPTGASPTSANCRFSLTFFQERSDPTWSL